MKKQAILVGIDEYDTLGALKFAREDAEAIAGALREYLGFEDADITLMTCGSRGALKPNLRYVENRLKDLRAYRELDLLVFGFFGHGILERPGERYLCLMDSDEDDLARTGLSVQALCGQLQQVQADNTLILLDCCQNQAAGRRTAAGMEMTSAEEDTLARLARDLVRQREDEAVVVPTVAILNACSEGERAFEWEERQQGLFTAHFLEGFAQGHRSLAPLAAWAAPRVKQAALKLHRKTQTPWVKIEGAGDIRFTVREAHSSAPPGSSRKTKTTPAGPGSVSVPPPLTCWYARIKGEEVEVLEDELASWVTRGEIRADSLVWRAGMAQWQRASDVGAFASFFVKQGPIEGRDYVLFVFKPTFLGGNIWTELGTFVLANGEQTVPGFLNKMNMWFRSCEDDDMNSAEAFEWSDERLIEESTVDELAALELPRDGREALLAEECGTDADLCREVDAMLAGEDDLDEFLDPGEPAAEIARTIESGGFPRPRTLTAPYPAPTPTSPSGDHTRSGGFCAY